MVRRGRAPEPGMEVGIDEHRGRARPVKKRRVLQASDAGRGRVPAGARRGRFRRLRQKAAVEQLVEQRVQVVGQVRSQLVGRERCAGRPLDKVGDGPQAVVRHLEMQADIAVAGPEGHVVDRIVLPVQDRRLQAKVEVAGRARRIEVEVASQVGRRARRRHHRVAQAFPSGHAPGDIADEGLERRDQPVLDPPATGEGRASGQCHRRLHRPVAMQGRDQPERWPGGRRGPGWLTCLLAVWGAATPAPAEPVRRVGATTDLTRIWAARPPSRYVDSSLLPASGCDCVAGRGLAVGL